LPRDERIYFVFFFTLNIFCDCRSSSGLRPKHPAHKPVSQSPWKKVSLSFLPHQHQRIRSFHFNPVISIFWGQQNPFLPTFAALHYVRWKGPNQARARLHAVQRQRSHRRYGERYSNRYTAGVRARFFAALRHMPHVALLPSQFSHVTSHVKVHRCK